jgi:hypothetical protein
MHRHILIHSHDVIVAILIHSKPLLTIRSYVYNITRLLQPFLKKPRQTDIVLHV